MNIQTFSQELRDGLGTKIKNNSLAYLSIPSIEENLEKVLAALPKAIAEANPNQHDLFYIKSILASTGWNKNDDVFDRIELFNARATPVDKPFNLMHIESDIIGHMTSAILIDHAGNVLSNDLSTLPQEFDSVVGSVIYRVWENPERKQQIEKIIAEIKDWFVSMECLFPHFDYAIKTPAGEHRVIARNEDSAFLTKHLRVYGGTGTYQGNRIGRLLRNFVFTGKGLVSRPGNARSVILASNNNKEVSSFNTVASVKAGEIFMTYTEEQYNAVVAEREAAKASVSEFKAKYEIVEKSKANLETDLNVTKETLTATKAELATVKTEAEKSKSELEKIKLESVKAERLHKLTKRVIEEAKAKELVEKFATVADEQFNALVEAYPAKSETSEEDEKKKKAEAEAEANKKAEAEKAEADKKALEDAKAKEEELRTAPETTKAALRTNLSQWIGKAIAKETTKKEGKK